MTELSRREFLALIGISTLPHQETLLPAIEKQGPGKLTFAPFMRGVRPTWALPEVYESNLNVTAKYPGAAGEFVITFGEPLKVVWTTARLGQVFAPRRKLRTGSLVSVEALLAGYAPGSR